MDNDSVTDAAGNSLGGAGLGNGSVVGGAYSINKLHDVTSAVTVGVLPFVNFLRFRMVTVTNAVKSPIQGPLVLLLENLPAGVTLVNRSGLTRTGKPFIRLLGGLAPGQRLAKLLNFNNPSGVAIQFNLRVFAGLGSP